MQDSFFPFQRVSGKGIALKASQNQRSFVFDSGRVLGFKRFKFKDIVLNTAGEMNQREVEMDFSFIIYTSHVNINGYLSKGEINMDSLL